MPDLFNVCKNHTTFQLRRQQSKKQFAVNDSDAPVTLKEGQGPQTWHELVDCKQAYNAAKFEKPGLNMKEPTIKFLVKSENMSTIPLEYMQK